jgi:pantothenate kinase-related protein Tda10
MFEGNYRQESELQTEFEKSYEDMYWTNYVNFLKKNYEMYLNRPKSITTMVDISIMELYERFYENATYNFYQKQIRKEKSEKMPTQKIKIYNENKEMEKIIIEDNKIIFSKSV